MTNMAKVVLLLLNMGFMVAGCLLVYFSHRIKSSGWLDAFEGDYAWVGSTTFVGMIILGVIVIVLAVLGCVGAQLRHKLVLTIYAGVLIATALLFAVLAFGAHSVSSKMSGWEDATYPASTTEASLGTNFNELYCYAMVPYYCETAKVDAVLDMFNESSLSSYVSSSTTNFTALCGVLDVSGIDTICEVCDLVSEYDSYSVVLSWAESECESTTEIAAWCGAFLLNGNASMATTGAPYTECRAVFLDLISTWSTTLMIGSIICCLAIVALFVFTCMLMRSQVSHRDSRAKHNAALAHVYRDSTP